LTTSQHSLSWRRKLKKKWDLIRVRDTGTKEVHGLVHEYLKNGYEPFAISIEPSATTTFEVIWLKKRS